MKRAHLFLSLVLVVAWLGSGMTQAAQPGAADDSAVQAVEPRRTPIGLTPAEWQRIQAQVAKLIAADGAWSNFGQSVSVTGNTAVVGTPNAAVGGNYGQGAAYVFYRNQGGANAWGQVAKLTAADGAAADTFGYSASISGDTIVVGAPTADVGGNNWQGAAYVFYRNQGGANAWGQAAKLAANDGAAQDDFGDSVAVSGDTVVVGAWVADVGGNADQGAAYVFYRNQGGPDAWGQVVKLTAAYGAAEDYFGDSVAVSGDTAVAGVPYADVGGNADQGAAYIFYRNQDGADAWGQVAKLTAAGTAGDFFGGSVSVSGDTVVAGAPYADVSAGDVHGAAYVFYRDHGGADAWGQVAKLSADDGAYQDEFGISVSVNGDTAVVGAELADVGYNSDQGAAYAFYRNLGGADAWGQAVKLTAADGGDDDRFGDSVSVSGDIVVVGAFWADVGGNDAQGAAYVFSLQPAPPVAADDAYCTAEDAPLDVPAVLGVLANDTDPNGDLLTAILDSGPSHGTLDLHADGSFAYTPTIGFTEVDTFTYHANDGALDSNIATVRITVPCHCIYLPLVLRN